MSLLTLSGRPFVIARAVFAGTVTLVLGSAATASAHITIGEGSVTAGAYENLTFSVPHGCGDSPTTRVAIRIPEGINAVTPTRSGFYTVKTGMKRLEQPITDSHGTKVTRRVDRVVYTAKVPLPADQRDTLTLTLQIPENAAGQTLNFPTVQSCKRGEAAWVQIPEDGQDSDALDAPAPSVRVLAATGEQSDDGDQNAALIAASATPDRTTLVVISLIVGGLGLIAGLAALVNRSRRA